MILDPHERTLWDAVLLVIKEANGRYGLKLYGHLHIDLDGYMLTWMAESGQRFGMSIDYVATARYSVPELAALVSEQVAPHVREIAETRDKLSRIHKEARGNYATR